MSSTIRTYHVKGRHTFYVVVECLVLPRLSGLLGINHIPKILTRDTN